MDGTRKKLLLSPEVKQVKANEYDITISSEAVDRDGDIIEVEGWQLDHYLKNPVVLWAHDYRGVPVGRALDVRKEKPNLVARFEFREAANEFDPVLPIRTAWEQGIIRASSVGFRPILSVPIEGTSADDWWAPRRFVQQELLEFSLVPVPANQEALRRGEYEAYVKALNGGRFQAAEQLVDSLDPRVVRGLEEVMQAIKAWKGK